MSVELRPLGVGCNIGCEYCYQQPQRDAGNLGRTYVLESMRAAIDREGGPFTLFGGEPLLMPLDDLESLWAWGLGRFGSNSIQTNGTLISSTHIELFRKYRVQVGISLDGPGDLNDVRWVGTLERTRDATAKAQRAIEALCREGIPPSVIVTLHRGNAARERLPALHAWVRELRALGVRAMRLHLLEVEGEAVRRKCALTDQENVDVLVSFAEIEPQLLPLRLDVFEEMRNLLRGDDGKASCVWHACDPYTTPAVQGVEGSGQRSNCGRTQKDGVDFVKADQAGYERYLALYQTPQAHGGCQGCRFFLMCKGQCPGTALDRDWRNRTEHCAIWKAIFGHLERQLLDRGTTPLSVHPSRPTVEARFLERWLRASACRYRRHSRACRNGASVGPAIDRLPFRLPDFTRIAWVSDSARAAWQPRVARIVQAWGEVERLSVRAGLRPCALQHVSPARLPALAEDCARHGLWVHPLALEGQPAAPYASEAVPVGPDVAQAFRVAIGGPAAVRQLTSAWEAGDQIETGRLLGYPACCRAFFQRVWIDERSVDTTWEMAVGTCADAALPASVDVDGPPQANILLRWLGVRAVPHLPCSFECRETVRLADGFLRVARESGYVSEAEWIVEMLSWPAEWSALHGIAEIKTPIAKIATRTDATADTRVVRRRARRYPAEGARGIAFPFQKPGRPAAASPRREDRVYPVGPPRALEDWYALDNGFASALAMTVAHRPIVELAAEFFGGRPGDVLDLGCGNGALLGSICAGNPRLQPSGVDVDPLKIAHARSLLPQFADGFFAGDMFNTEAPWMNRRVDLAILMPGRLVEMDSRRAERLRACLRAMGGVLLVYAYDDWITRPGGLEGLCVCAGLRIASARRQHAALAVA